MKHTWRTQTLHTMNFKRTHAYTQSYTHKHIYTQRDRQTQLHTLLHTITHKTCVWYLQKHTYTCNQHLNQKTYSAKYLFPPFFFCYSFSFPFLYISLIICMCIFVCVMIISRFTEVQFKIHDSYLLITHTYTQKSTYTQNKYHINLARINLWSNI